MAKWQYHACVVRGEGPDQVEEQLNSNLKQLGEQGWRFIETFYAHNGLPVLLFKKPSKLNVKLGEDQPSAPRVKHRPPENT